MPELTYTLLGDGSSDKALLPIINWTFQQHHPTLVIQAQWADFSLLPDPPPISKLPERIRKAIDLYPCNLLFIHRDAEGQAFDDRRKEIMTAWRLVEHAYVDQRSISIVPIRMTEAWLLFNEQAIRTAAGNPSGKQRLQLPAFRMVETLPNPKRELQQLLREASGLTGRRLQGFKVSRAVQIVANNIDDFAPLRNLSAFASFEESISNLAID